MIMSDMRGGSGEGASGEDLEGEQLFAMKVNNKVRQLKSKLIFTLLTVHWLNLNYLIESLYKTHFCIIVKFKKRA